MASLEQMTQQALAKLTQQKGEDEAQQFLRDQFALSEEEAKSLVQPIDPKRLEAVGKIVQELHDHLNEVKVGEFEGFLQKWFPFLSQQARAELVTMLDREILPPYYDAATATLVHDALERLRFEAGEDPAREFLANFKTLSSDAVEELAQPVTASRHQGVVKVLNSFAQESQKLNIGEMKGKLAEKLPSLSPTDRVKLLSELARETSSNEQPRYKHMNLKD